MLAPFSGSLAWGHGLAGVVWHGGCGLASPEQLASAGNQFSKIGPIALSACFTLLHVDACLEHQNSAVASKPVSATHMQTDYFTCVEQCVPKVVCNF